jgi:outer membrane protein assembly factor BamB
VKVPAVHTSVTGVAARRLFVIGTVTAVAIGAAVAGGTAGAAAPSHVIGGDVAARLKPEKSATAFSYLQAWKEHVSQDITFSAPVPITIGKIPSLVVGGDKSPTGAVYAFSLATGRLLSGWPVATPTGGVNSTPSVNGNLIYVGTYNVDNHASGGYMAINASDHQQAWYRTVPVDPGTAETAGVSASLAVGMLNGQKSVVAGSLGQYADELRSSTGATRSGFPWMSSDSEFSSPAIADIYGNGRNYIIGGAEQTGNASIHEAQGGHLWVLNGDGSAGPGHASPVSTGAVCQYAPNQGVMSSPAVGRFLSSNRVGIAFGTGYDFHTPIPSASNDLFAVNSHCSLEWTAHLDGITLSSPALVDALGNGQLQVAEATAIGFFPGTSGNRSGTAYLLNGATGHVIWSHQLPEPVLGSITSANLGGGHQDLLVPTINGLYILDGKTGRQVAYIGSGVALLNAPLVTDNANGTIGITIAGGQSGGGEIEHFNIGNTNGRLADEAGAWPMFHHDPQLTGTTLARLK